jgi:hypothetical protein
MILKIITFVLLDITNVNEETATEQGTYKESFAVDFDF